MNPLLPDIKLKKNYFIIVSFFLILYFFTNLLSGDRGLFSYFEKKDLLNKLEKEEMLLTKQIKDTSFKNSLLSDNLDLDFVEILIREKFLFGKEGEKIYIIKSNEK